MQGPVSVWLLHGRAATGLERAALQGKERRKAPGTGCCTANQAPTRLYSTRSEVHIHQLGVAYDRDAALVEWMHGKFAVQVLVPAQAEQSCTCTTKKVRMR